ncbi:ankyrin repeat domain-containing protein [Fibrella arboris]|uniref:ankyrin repeat domain-containing protein n=1 Tax=Fibrella arboris TaxID=3242486 RepID=UPI00352268F8
MDPERYFEGIALQLAQAIQQNRLDEVERLAGQAELNQFYRENMTLLIWAILADRQEALDLLLRAGANPNLTSDDGIQPVALAAGAKEDNPNLKVLLRHGGDPNSKSRGEPALHIAFDSEYYTNVELLLNAKADINIRDEHDDTILIKAGYQEKFARAAALIQRGADINASSEGGGIALEVQQATPKIGSKTYQEQAQLRQLLISRGVHFPIFHPSYKPYTALLARWHQTPEGQQWNKQLTELGLDPTGFGAKWVELDRKAWAAFKAWMKTNRIAEPGQTKPQFIDPNG